MPKFGGFQFRSIALRSSGRLLRAHMPVYSKLECIGRIHVDRIELGFGGPGRRHLSSWSQRCKLV